MVLDLGYLEDKNTLGKLESGLSPILVTTNSGTRVPTADVLPCEGTADPWWLQASVRAIAVQDPKRL